MSTITKERLIKIQQWRETYGPGSNVMLPAEEAEELARIALASLEAKPIGAFHISDQQVGGTTDYIKDGEWPIDDGVIEVYAAPPAPVFVPDDIPDSVYEILCQACGGGEKACNFADELWNACRAAMLHGAEPVTTANKLRDAVDAIRNSGIVIDDEKILAERDALNAPDCWCHTCRPVTISDMRFVVCPECGNKRCPHANDHRNACTGSNEPGQEGSAYPAAPQQETK
ncbi:hypothetical protein [Enterobacter kobei]|uniref:hypothetical protein n=1 Tax=Enterobacter kobei TaxID=208224 RepID=UPI0031791D74